MPRYEIIETWNAPRAAESCCDSAETMREARKKLTRVVLEYAAPYRKDQHERWSQRLNDMRPGDCFHIAFTQRVIEKHNPYCYSVTDHTTHSLYSAVYYIRKFNCLHANVRS